MPLLSSCCSSSFRCNVTCTRFAKSTICRMWTGCNADSFCYCWWSSCPGELAHPVCADSAAWMLLRWHLLVGSIALMLEHTMHNWYGASFFKTLNIVGTWSAVINILNMPHMSNPIQVRSMCALYVWCSSAQCVAWLTSSLIVSSLLDPCIGLCMTHLRNTSHSSAD